LYYWNCVCSCGKHRVIRGDSITQKHTKSCGCLRDEIVTKRATVHGLCKSRIHAIWGNMLNRCNNKSHGKYKNYGGRGIKVCDRWCKFENFFADMGPDNGLEIDRIDNDKGYEPGNCRWVTHRENSFNKSNNRRIEFRGETKCVSEWADVLGVNVNMIYGRLHRGWTTSRALSVQSNKKYRLES